MRSEYVDASQEHGSGEHRLCSVSELSAVGEVEGFTAGSIEIAVFNVGGQYFAAINTCSHEWSPLTDGYIDNGARFDIRTGAALCLPAHMPLMSCAIRIEHDDVFVTLPAGHQAVSPNSS